MQVTITWNLTNQILRHEFWCYSEVTTALAPEDVLLLAPYTWSTFRDLILTGGSFSYNCTKTPWKLTLWIHFLGFGITTYVRPDFVWVWCEVTLCQSILQNITKLNDFRRLSWLLHAVTHSVPRCKYYLFTRKKPCMYLIHVSFSMFEVYCAYISSPINYPIRKDAETFYLFPQKRNVSLSVKQLNSRKTSTDLYLWFICCNN